MPSHFPCGPANREWLWKKTEAEKKRKKKYLISVCWKAAEIMLYRFSLKVPKFLQYSKKKIHNAERSK